MKTEKYVEPLYNILLSAERQYGLDSSNPNPIELIKIKSSALRLFEKGIKQEEDNSISQFPEYKNQLVQEVIQGSDSYFSAFERFRDTGSPHDLENLKTLVPDASVIRGERGLLYKIQKFISPRKSTNESGWITTLYLQVNTQMYADEDLRWSLFSIEDIPKRTPGRLWKTKPYFHALHLHILEREYDLALGKKFK